MVADYASCRFSLTVKTDDPSVLHMLRGLSQHCESGPYKQLAWGGTTTKSWQVQGGQVTFRFSRPSDRDKFHREAGRLLPGGSWHEVARSDSDPATRQR